MDYFPNMALWPQECSSFSASVDSPSRRRLRGNTYGIIGMILAVLTVLVGIEQGDNLDLGKAAPLLGGTILVGFVIGGFLAARVAMTAMPQLVAILHSFVGLAAVPWGSRATRSCGSPSGWAHCSPD